MGEKVPNGWVYCKFGDVCYLQNGYAFSSEDYSKIGVNLIRISNIQNNKVTVSDCVKVCDNIDNCFRVNKGDLLLAMSGATTGKTGIYLYDDFALLNQRVGNLKIYSEKTLIPKYRDYFIINKQQEILKKAYGGAQPNISKQIIEDLDFPLPPLPEQQRIVDKIEHIFSHCDRGIEKLKSVRDKIKLYKQSVLNYAFTGKLYKVNEWRECKLEDVLSYEQPTKYIVSNTNYVETGTPVLTAGKSFLLGYTNDKTGIFDDKDKLPVIIFDDFTTANKLVDFPFKVKSSAMKILHSTEKANIYYLYYLMQTIHYKAETHKRYWISDYSKQIVSLPSLPEQQIIVKEIEKRFSKADKLLKAVESALEQAQKLKQSVLKKAFEGRLVPQDPNDEPAEVLLERVKKDNKNLTF